MSNEKQGRAPNGNKKKSSNKTYDVSFVNYTMTKEDKARCKVWLLTLDDMDSAAIKLAEEGYKFSLKWDAYSEAFAAFLSTTEEKTGNVGYLLAGRGSTPLKALKQAMFIHWVVFEGNWAAHYTRRESDELDD